MSIFSRLERLRKLALTQRILKDDEEYRIAGMPLSHAIAQEIHRDRVRLETGRMNDMECNKLHASLKRLMERMLQSRESDFANGYIDSEGNAIPPLLSWHPPKGIEWFSQVKMPKGRES